MNTRGRLARLEKARRRGIGPVVVIVRDVPENPDLYHTHPASVRRGLSHLVDEPDEVIDLAEAHRRAGPNGHVVIVTYDRTEL